MPYHAEANGSNACVCSAARVRSRERHQGSQNPADFYERNRRILRVPRCGAGGNRTLVRQVVT